MLAQREDLVPIPGSRSGKRVEENVAALQLHLTATDLRAICSALGDGPHGARHIHTAVWD